MGMGWRWARGTVTTGATLAAGADPPSTALDATGTIWAFFAAHRR